MPIIKIPCSTANMGSGFDSIGMALTMYNEIEIQIIEKGLEIVIKNPDEFKIATDERNLIYRSILEGLKVTGVPMPGLRIIQTNNIPQTRGLAPVPPAWSAASSRPISSAAECSPRMT